MPSYASPGAKPLKKPYSSRRSSSRSSLAGRAPQGRASCAGRCPARGRCRGRSGRGAAPRACRTARRRRAGSGSGSITPPEPTRIRRVRAAAFAISTSGAELAIPGMLWCSAYHRRQVARAGRPAPPGRSRRRARRPRVESRASRGRRRAPRAGSPKTGLAAARAASWSALTRRAAGAAAGERLEGAVGELEPDRLGRLAQRHERAALERRDGAAVDAHEVVVVAVGRAHHEHRLAAAGAGLLDQALVAPALDRAVGGREADAGLIAPGRARAARGR